MIHSRTFCFQPFWSRIDFRPKVMRINLIIRKNRILHIPINEGLIAVPYQSNDIRQANLLSRFCSDIAHV